MVALAERADLLLLGGPVPEVVAVSLGLSRRSGGDDGGAPVPRGAVVPGVLDRPVPLLLRADGVDVDPWAALEVANFLAVVVAHLALSANL